MVWRIFSDLDRMRDRMGRSLNEPWRPGWTFFSRPGDPTVNVYETPEEYIVHFEAPGAKKEAFDVSFTAGVLKVRGEYGEFDVGGTLIRSELPSGSFARTVKLGDKVDPNKLEGAYEDGVLTVRLAKSEAARPKQIEVKVN